MGTRRKQGLRKPCGRLRQSPKSEMMSPTEQRRLIDMARAGLKDSLWATQLGRLRLVDKLSPSQFSAGVHWSKIVADYAEACGAPSEPRTMKLELGSGGAPADPDSDVGRKEAQRHERAVASFREAVSALQRAGPSALKAVESVCERDWAPVGGELESLKLGLETLATFWASAAKRRRSSA